MQKEKYIPTHYDIEWTKNFIESLPIGAFWMTSWFLVKRKSKQELNLLPYDLTDEDCQENIDRFANVLEQTNLNLKVNLFIPTKDIIEKILDQEFLGFYKLMREDPELFKHIRIYTEGSKSKTFHTITNNHIPEILNENLLRLMNKYKKQKRW